MAPKSKGRVVDPATFLPGDDIANLSVEHPYDGRSARRFGDRYGTYGIGEGDGGRRERRRDDEDTSRADADMEWRRGGPPARTDSRPMGGMRREGGSGGDFGGGFRARNPPSNDIEINRSGLQRSEMSRGGAGRPPYGGAASSEARPGFGFGDRGRMERNRSQDEPEGEWRSSKPATVAAPAAAPAAPAAGRKRINFGALSAFTEGGNAAAAPAPKKAPEQPSPAKETKPEVVEESKPARRDPSPPPAPEPPVVKPSELAVKPSEPAAKSSEPAPVESSEPATKSPEPAVESAEPASAGAKPSSEPAVQPSPTAAGGKAAKINFDSLWSAPRQPRSAARPAEASAAAPVPRLPARRQAAAPAAASVEKVDASEEPQVEKKKKRINEKKAALRAARAKKVESDGHKARSDIVRRNLIRGCAQDIDSICSALDPIISAETPLDVAAAGAELDRIVGTLEKTDSVWDSTLLLACVHVVIVKEIAAVAEDLMAMDGWSEYTPAQIEAAVDEKLVPEAETCVRNATPVVLAAKQRLDDFLGHDFEFVNLQEIIKSVSNAGCPRLTPSLTITELVLIAWLTQSPELVTPELVIEWSDDNEDDTEGRSNALAHIVHLLKWLQGGIADDKASDSEEEQEESDED